MRLIRLAIVLATATAPALADTASCTGFHVAPCMRLPVEEPTPSGCTGLCAALDDQLERGCRAAQDQPYADTIFLRRGLVGDVPEDARRALTLAALAESLDGVAEQLAPLSDQADPLVRYAAALQIALAGARAGQISDPRVAAAFEVMEANDPGDLPKSDLTFLRALAAEATGDQIAALALAQKAHAQEPRFFNALALEMRLRLAQGQNLRGSSGAFASSALCEEEFTGLLAALAQVADLEPCASTAAHLELYLSRNIVVPAEAPGLQAATIYLAVLSRRRDLAEDALARFRAAPRPVCAAVVGQKLEGLIDLLDTGEAQ